MIAVVVGVAIGAAATQGLHAQVKLKAYSISMNVITDDTAVAKYLPAVRKAIADNHGKSLLTLRGRVVPIEAQRRRPMSASSNGTASTML